MQNENSSPDSPSTDLQPTQLQSEPSAASAPIDVSLANAAALAMDAVVAQQQALEGELGVAEGVATDETSADTSVLGTSGVAGVLLIASDDLNDFTHGESAHEVRRRLFEMGQNVSMAGITNWRGVLENSQPEIVLLEPGHDPTRARDLCREVKSECDQIGALVAVTLPPLNVEHPLPREARSWDFWQTAGADAMLPTDVSAPELQAQFELWARFARLQRAHLSLRDTLGKQVQIDDLTQVLNRRFFFQAAHREVSRARRYDHPMSCLMIDINFFKLWNKTFGYACGDAILRGVAQIIRTWTRESDIVARFGAKKFVILLPETDVEGAMQLHEKLQREVNEHAFKWQNTPLQVTISIGEAERQRNADRLREESKRALRQQIIVPITTSQPLADNPKENDENGEESPTNRDEFRFEGEEAPISIREELADLLEDADAALYVAKKGVRYPNLNFNRNRDHEIIGILGAE